MAVEIPHFSLPFRRDLNGRAVVVEQDSDEEIVDCVEVLLSTEKGSREEIPEYGIPDQVFRQNGADLAQIGASIDRWEPRAEHFLERDGYLIDMVDRVRVNIMESGSINLPPPSGEDLMTTEEGDSFMTEDDEDLVI